MWIGSKTFKGSASKIIFFSNSKVQLIGKSAVMNYDNINISSNSIIFNPENGKMSSNANSVENKMLTLKESI